MNVNINFSNIKNSILGLAFSSLVLSCGSFKSASYFESDGIYVSNSNRPQETQQEVNKNTYYSQYFKEVAEGNIAENSEEVYFTDTDGYSSSGQNQNNTSDNGYDQIPWGGETSQTEIIVVNNSPNYLWGLSGFSFRYSPFWNNYYGNHFRFGFGNFYNPYFGYYGSSLAGYWGGFNSFYSPFNYYGGMYSPYGFRNAWNRNGFANRFRNGFMSNNNDYNSTVARIKSGRGEKNYGDSTRNSKIKGDRESKTNDTDIQRTINRINVGRGVNSLGRNVLIGNGSNNRLGNKTIGGSRTARPNVSGGSSGVTGLSRNSNSNPTKSVKSSSGRFSQSRYNAGARNNTKTTSPRTRRPVQRNVVQPRTTRQYNNNRSTNNSSYRTNNNTSRSNSYSSPARSYSSGSSSRPSSSSTGRGSSGSSSGGRKN